MKFVKMLCTILEMDDTEKRKDVTGTFTYKFHIYKEYFFILLFAIIVHYLIIYF